MIDKETKGFALRPLGSTNIRWTPVGLGTWEMERKSQSSIAALQAGIEEGANHIDTAEMYGDGQVEEIVGKAIQKIRAKVFVVSKVLPSNASYEGTLAACDRSLKRLKTDYLDVYLLHWREKRSPLSETFRAFEKLKEQGKIRQWGVSNFDTADLEEATKLVGDGKIVCNQVLYHLNERSIELNVIPWCESHQVAVVAYSPFGQGHLPKNPQLEAVAKTYHVSPEQVALAFLTKKPSVFAIPKSSDTARTQENVRAMALTLTPRDVENINQAFPVKPRKRLPTI